MEDLYPVYVVEILTNRGTIRKAIPTDRLKKTSKCIEPVELELNSENADPNETDNALNDLDRYKPA